MGFLGFLGFIVILSIAFALLEKKYQLKARYRYYDSFKRKVRIGAVISVIVLLASLILARQLDGALGTYVGATQLIFATPLFLYSWVRTEDPVVKKDKKEPEIEFCYYCGRSLDESNVCPSCGKEVER